MHIGTQTVEAPEESAEEPLRTVDEVAVYLRVGRTTVYKLIADGSLTTVQIGRRRLCAADDLRAYVQRLRAGATNA